jgi:hypothetical protein
MLGGIADDPKAAEQLAGGWGGRLDKSMLIRSAREIASQLVATLPSAQVSPDGGDRQWTTV